MKTKAIALCLLLAAAHAGAEVLTMTDSQSAQPAAGSSVQTPGRGTSQASVAARYGEPKQRLAPVGQPPITRWVYDSFTVYFEGDRVIHAVINK